jgi:hypothetical protein
MWKIADVNHPFLKLGIFVTMCTENRSNRAINVLICYASPVLTVWHESLDNLSPWALQPALRPDATIRQYIQLMICAVLAVV